MQLKKDQKGYYRLYDGQGRYVKYIGKDRKPYDDAIKDSVKLAALLKSDPSLLADKRNRMGVKRIRAEAERQQERKLDSHSLSNVPPIPLGPFATIILDPPWDWGDEGDIDQFGRDRPTYSTMTIDEVADLPILSRSSPNCHLYLWITNRSLPKGFRLLETWGFRYITLLTWSKPYFGMGNYFRGQTEHIMFGVKGSLPLLRHDMGTAFSFPRGNGHSVKPDEMYDILATCSPEPRLEMFARKPHAGWVSWGAKSEREA